MGPALAFLLVLAGPAELRDVELSPYALQDEDFPERESIRKREPVQEPSAFTVPTVIAFGPTFYPSIRFSDSPISSRTGFGLDARFSLASILGLVPLHAHIGVTWVEDKSDFDLTIFKLGTGFHMRLGGAVSFSASAGVAYLMGDVSGSHFSVYLELSLQLRDVLFADSHIGLGLLTLTNVSGEIGNQDLDQITGFMAIIGVCP